MIRVSTILFILILSSLTAFAQGPGWTNYSTITSLADTANGGFNLSLSPGLTNCVSQSGYGSTYASIYPTHPGIKLIKADLLAAYMTGKLVRLYLTDANCTVGEIILGGN